MDDGDGVAGSLDDGGFVGADEAVGFGVGEGLLEQAVAEALGGLGEDDELAGNGGGDESAVSGAFDLFNGVDGGEADDGRAELDDGVDGAVDGVGVDEGADGIVDKDNVVGLGGDGGEGVGDGLLAMVATLDNVDARGKVVGGAELGDLGLGAFHFSFADGDIDGRDALDRGEGAERVDEDGDAVEGEKLLGLGAGHTGSQTRGGKTREYLHTGGRIARGDERQGEGRREEGRERRGKREKMTGSRDEGGGNRNRDYRDEKVIGRSRVGCAGRMILGCVWQGE